MNYKEFFEYVRESIEKFMGEKYSVTLNKVVKNNGLELMGLVIMEDGKTAAPTIYLDDFFEEYMAGTSLGDIIEKVVEIYEENSDKLEIDFSFFMDYGKMKDRIMYKLLNYEANEKMLLDIPHKKYMDLAVVFYVMIEHDTIGSGSVLIHNNHAEIWQVNEEDLYETAVSNTPKFLKYRFSSMENIVEEIFCEGEAEDFLENGEFSEHDMYVLTNNRKMFGAACLLYDGLLRKISNKLKSNLYIIPSSIHELIIIPQKAFPHDKEDLIEMVRTINANEVDTVDVLSDNVYEYCRATESMTY